MVIAFFEIELTENSVGIESTKGKKEYVEEKSEINLWR